MALLLQTYERVSDEEAKARADFDLRWKVALGIGLEERPFAKSTLQLFRARLVLHQRVRAVFEQSLAFARQTGFFRASKIKVVLDTSYILGRGAVKDTYNLLADGIGQLIRALAALAGRTPEEWARERGLDRYFGSSLKGEAAIEWEDSQAREVFLQGVVADADRLLALAHAGSGSRLRAGCTRWPTRLRAPRRRPAPRPPATSQQTEAGGAGRGGRPCSRVPAPTPMRRTRFRLPTSRPAPLS
jgi:hypothetical protein